ncbi:MAG: sensor histidine kinase, partial [Promethearchaeia archaeon]
SRLRANDFPQCQKWALEEEKPIYIEEPGKVCTECPLSSRYGDHGVLTARMEYRHRIFGIITATFPEEMADISEEKALFGELVQDIAFALHQLALEEKEHEARERLNMALNRSKLFKDLLAHDMNNIINNIKSAFQLMKMENIELIQSPKKKELIKIVTTQLDQGELLIKNVNNLSELCQSKPEIKPVDLKNVLKQALSHVKAQFEEKKMKIALLFPQHQVMVKGGPLLNLAFENILRNAFIHNKNTIKKIWIVISSPHRAKGYVKIEFKDNGVGITDRRKEVIFKRESPPHQGNGGMGIGLSLVKKIITQYHGKIWAEDRIKGEPKRGSNFVVLLKANE